MRRRTRTTRGVALLGVLLLGSRCLFPVAHAADPPAELTWVYEYLLATADTEHELAIVTDRIRYAAILARVAAETPDSKLKRYASLPVEAAAERPPVVVRPH